MIRNSASKDECARDAAFRALDSADEIGGADCDKFDYQSRQMGVQGCHPQFV